MVREMLSASGSSYENPAANFYRVTRDPKPTMEKTTQVFLGVRMVCAQCHDHPFERWTQNQYYEMAAFFSAVGLRPGYEVGEEILYDQRAGLRHEASQGWPRDEAQVHRAGHLVGHRARPPTDAQPPQALAEWLTAERQPFLREIHRQSRVELFLRTRHHRSRGRHPRFESAQQSSAAGCAYQGFHRSRLRSAASDAHHRQLADLSGLSRDATSGTRRMPRTFPMPCRGASAPKN